MDGRIEFELVDRTSKVENRIQKLADRIIKLKEFKLVDRTSKVEDSASNQVDKTSKERDSALNLIFRTSKAQYFYSVKI